jgi:hypothetical protein
MYLDSSFAFLPLDLNILGCDYKHCSIYRLSRSYFRF